MRRGSKAGDGLQDVLEKQQTHWTLGSWWQLGLGRSTIPTWSYVLLTITVLTIFLGPVEAVFLPENSHWSNCLALSIQNSSPQLQLQWVPQAVWATFNSSGPQYNLNITVYGNVTGQTSGTPLPASDNSSWTDTSITAGKIPDKNNQTGKESTLFTTLNVLGYTPYSSPGTRFCDSVINNDQTPVCPVAPFFPGK